MFIYVKHGDKEQFLVNPNCPLNILLQHLREKLGLPDTELVDLYDDLGTLKLLFLSQNPQENAAHFFEPRSSVTIGIVNRNPKDGSYLSITPLEVNPTPALLDILQVQIDNQEKIRLRQLRTEEGRKSRTKETPGQAQPTHPPKFRGRAV